MDCPKCGSRRKVKVTVSGVSIDGQEWVRQRVCLTCRLMWTTRELFACRLASVVPENVRGVARTRDIRRIPAPSQTSATSGNADTSTS